MQTQSNSSRTDKQYESATNVYSIEEVRYAKALSDISMKMNGFPLSLEDVYFERQRESKAND